MIGVKYKLQFKPSILNLTYVRDNNYTTYGSLMFNDSSKVIKGNRKRQVFLDKPKDFRDSQAWISINDTSRVKWTLGNIYWQSS